MIIYSATMDSALHNGLLHQIYPAVIFCCWLCRKPRNRRRAEKSLVRYFSVKALGPLCEKVRNKRVRRSSTPPFFVLPHLYSFPSSRLSHFSVIFSKLNRVEQFCGETRGTVLKLFHLFFFAQRLLMEHF